MTRRYKIPMTSDPGDFQLTPPDEEPKRGKHYVKLRGHAWTPGSCPKGETCKTCKHYTRKHLAKVYLKCGLNQHNWTGGRASDIRARDPACQHWKPEN